jgi:hypothetical protein
MQFKYDAAETEEIIDKFHQATKEINHLNKKLSDEYRLNIKLIDENKEATDKVNSLRERIKRHENQTMRLIDNYEAMEKNLEGKIEEKDEIIEQKELEIKRLETQLHKTQRKSRKKSKRRSTAAP